MATPKYNVVIRQFDGAPGFGKGTVVAMFDNALNVGWSEYINDVGEAFFTLSQDDPNMPSLVGNRMLLDMLHMEIYRDNELVWAGWLGEADENNDDVIFYGYSYLSGLYYLLSDWDQEWTNANVSTIFSDLWTRAKTTLTWSRMNWMTTGTIESPVTTSGGAVTLTMPFYNIFKKRILMAYKELAAYAISDTTNHVSFEITPAGVFNLYKNRGTDNTTRTTFQREGPGRIRNYRRLWNPVDWRSTIYAVGSSPNDIDLQEEEDNSSLENIGRREEPIFLQWVRDATELQRVAKLRAQRAGAENTDLIISMYPNTIVPYRATGADYALADTFTVDPGRGLSASNPESKIVVGQQIMFARGAENVRVLFTGNL